VRTNSLVWQWTLALLLLCGADAGAQSLPAPPRGDATGIISWQLAETGNGGRPYDYDNWHSAFFGGASAGLYWTEHLKVELDVGASTTAESYRSRPVDIDGRRTFQTSRLEFSRRTLGVSQHYQFFENAWFHPHVAAGLHATWERRTERFEPAYVFDGPASRVIADLGARVEGPETTMRLRPFLAAGFKAYLTPRSFFRSDVRFAFRRGLEESQARIGFGVDF
jgi:hypothetical protein